MNIILFGFGRIGKIHYENLLKNSNFNVKYIVENKDSNIKIDNVSVIKGDYLDLIKNEKIDLALVCTPTHTHYEIIINCLNNNINVFSEKPVSLNIKEVKECYELSKKKNLKLLCAFNRRFDPDIINLRDNYQKGEYGKAEQIIITSRDYPYPSASYLKISGGIYQDCIIHDIDSVCWILNELPYKVFSSSSKTVNEEISAGNLDNVTTILTFGSGIMVTLISSRIANSYDQRIEILNNNGIFSIKNPNIEHSISFDERYADSYKNELEHLYDIIKNRKDCKISYNDCYNAYTICEYASKSNKSNKEEIIIY